MAQIWGIKWMIFNIARHARYKPCGPHTFGLRQTTDSQSIICCSERAEGRKPVGRCKNLFVFNIVQPFRFRWMVSIMSFVEWASPKGLKSV